MRQNLLIDQTKARAVRAFERNAATVTASAKTRAGGSLDRVKQPKSSHPSL